MRNITLSAQEEAIEKARRVAERRHSTLNTMFREWLDNLTRIEHGGETSERLQTIWGRTNYLRVGKKLSRDEMNER